VLTGYYVKKDSPEKLRRVKFFDAETGKRLSFLTNQFSLPALTIAQLYRSCWQVDVCLKKCKQLFGLGKDQSNDFNPQVFATTASFPRYNLLNNLNSDELEKEVKKGKTFSDFNKPVLECGLH
jgi:hypothetical protein